MKKSKMTQNDLRDAFPVMRFDYNKRLIDSNLTALPLLGEWKCRKGAKIPSAILKAYPEINFVFNDKVPTECKVTFSGLNIWFDMVPYPEAGYVGLYGYHVESMVPETVQQKLRMAG
ncbi:MAG: hypothetical protein IPJ86_18705 [Bacteroidetes bacterium]|jgi:hypothetical protein|nr:hypothetical protein [Bacteroidota bacterium]MBK9317954.1 hypothetical protein [Bacteroidota bacterium]MBL0096623.1 hypothetical protein [Bacteroidota bacterium]